MVQKTSLVESKDFSYIAEIRKLITPVEAFSFSITTVWRSAKNPTAEQTALQVTLDRADLIALRDAINAELQS